MNHEEMIEEAQAPTDDELVEQEVQDLATVIGNVVIDYEDTGPHSKRPITIRDTCADWPMEIAGEVQAAGFRRPAQTEPTDDEQGTSCGTYADQEGISLVLLKLREAYYPQGLEALPCDAIAFAITSAGFRRPAQTDPTDAQVIAALNAWHQDVMPVNWLGVFGTQKEDLMRAALKAAFAAGQEETK